MVNIGAIMEYGATITMPNGGTIIIPPRPFMHPVMDKHTTRIRNGYIEGVEKDKRKRLTLKCNLAFS